MDSVKMNVPLISVIIPCYNHAKYIVESIESIILQTFSNWEIIVVDDGSVDSSATILKLKFEKNARITYIYQDNSGPSAARNNGVMHSKGKYLFFLDGDDKIDSDYLERGVSYMEGHPSCAVYYADLYYFGDKQGNSGIHYTSYKSLLCKSSVPCCTIIRRTDFDRIGGFDVSMRGYEDWEFFIRLLYHNDEVFQDHNCKYHYRIVKSNSSVNSNANKNSNNIMAYIYTKHKDKYTEFLGDPINAYIKADYLQEEIVKLLNSKVYRLGKSLIAPIVKFLSFFKHV